MLAKLKYILISMRAEQWVKNLLLFAGLIFSGNLFHLEALVRVSIGFLCFGLLASSVYLFNDVRDREQDRIHVEKQNRPIAVGLLGIHLALFVATVLAALALSVAFTLDTAFFAILSGYLLVNIAYTLWIKKAVILDILAIASGFVFRVLAGTQLAKVTPSDWLILCTITLSLFLGFSKRRHELATVASEAELHRKVLGEYSIEFLDQMIAVATACTVMSYALYTVSPQTVARFGTRNLGFTIPFVIYGIYRYLYLIHQKNLGGNPARDLLSDPPLLINAFVWVVVVVIVIYPGAFP